MVFARALESKHRRKLIKKRKHNNGTGWQTVAGGRSCRYLMNLRNLDQPRVSISTRRPRQEPGMTQCSRRRTEENLEDGPRAHGDGGGAKENSILGEAQKATQQKESAVQAQADELLGELERQAMEMEFEGGPRAPTTPTKKATLTEEKTLGKETKEPHYVARGQRGDEGDKTGRAPVPNLPRTASNS